MPGSEMGPFDLIGESLQEHVEGRTVNGVPPALLELHDRRFLCNRGLLPHSEEATGRGSMAVPKPRPKGNDGLYSILGGLNYYIRGDDLKLMVNYVHTWSDFRQANPEFGEDQFDEVLGRYR